MGGWDMEEMGQHLLEELSELSHTLMHLEHVMQQLWRWSTWDYITRGGGALADGATAPDPFGEFIWSPIEGIMAKLERCIGR